MTKSVLEAYDSIAFAAQCAARLAELAPALEERIGRDPERTWLATAAERLRETCAPLAPLLEQARALPELKVVRQENTAELIGVWVDAVEKLLAGIMFHAGPRSPMIQAIFTHQKFAQLRRAGFEGASEYAAELDRRLRSSYIERLLAQDDFAFARPVIEQAQAAWAAVVANEGDLALPEAEARAIGEALQAAAADVELSLEAARLVVRAALLRVPDAFAETGLDTKPKKRAAPKLAAPVEETPEVIEEDVPVPEEVPEPVALPDPEPAPPAKKRKRAKSTAAAEHSA